MKPIIIGVCGLKGSGKDEVFHALNYGFKGVRHVCLSDPIYEEASKLLGTPVTCMKADKAYYRPLLQWWGIHQRKVHGEDYWVDRAMTQFNKVKRRANVVVFTSVRMWSELTAIRKLGGTLWKVVRPSVECDGHITEEQQLQFNPDIGLHNDGSLEDFHETVQAAFLEQHPESAKFWKTE